MQVLSSESERKNPAGSLKRNMTESDFLLYELANKSEILEVQDVIKLENHMPARAIGIMKKNK